MSHPGVMLTYDRPRNGRYDLIQKALSRLGELEPLSPRTSFVLRPYPGVRFGDISRTVIRNVDPEKSVAAMTSLRTGLVYNLNNRGNRRGRFYIK
jgi:hypothetical protein